MVLLLGKAHQSGELGSKIWSLLVQQVRFRNRPNLKRPLPMHYNRARMLAVCEPVYPPPPKNCAWDAILDKQKEEKSNIKENPYAVFLAGKLRRDLTNHPLVCIFHHGSYTQHELINIRGLLYDMKFDMKIQETLNVRVVEMALSGTRWSPLIHLFRAKKTAIGFCSEVELPKLSKALKKMPQFCLIAAVVHDNILHKEAVEALEKLRDITNVRAQLCATLANPSVTISHNLSANLTALSHSLETYAKGEDTSSSSSSSSSDSESSSSDSDKEKE